MASIGQPVCRSSAFMVRVAGRAGRCSIIWMCCWWIWSMSAPGFTPLSIRWPIVSRPPPRWHKKVVVLDRPNPIGGLAVEGNVLDPALSLLRRSLSELPMRHGMTIGELARFFNREAGIGAELEVVEMEGWQRSMYFDDTGLPWVFPSPNMPTLQTALVYPGQVVWEGTHGLGRPGYDAAV